MGAIGAGVAFVLPLLAVFAAPVGGRYSRWVAVLARPEIVLDRDLGNRDLWGAIRCTFGPDLAPRLGASVAMLSSSQATVIGADFVDRAPMRNAQALANAGHG